MDAVLVGKLLDAGFSKEEILSLIPAAPMTSQQEAAADDPEPVDAEPEATTDAESVAPDPDKGPAAETDTAMEQRLYGIEKSIADLTKTIQAANRKHDSIGGFPDSLEDETDRIMKSIIRPEHEKKG